MFCTCQWQSQSPRGGTWSLGRCQRQDDRRAEDRLGGRAPGVRQSQVRSRPPHPFLLSVSLSLSLSLSVSVCLYSYIQSSFLSSLFFSLTDISSSAALLSESHQCDKQWMGIGNGTGISLCGLMKELWQWLSRREMHPSLQCYEICLRKLIAKNSGE